MISSAKCKLSMATERLIAAIRKIGRICRQRGKRKTKNMSRPPSKSIKLCDIMLVFFQALDMPIKKDNISLTVMQAPEAAHVWIRRKQG